MAHVLNLVYGATTITLASGDYRISRYVPGTPGVGDEEITESAVIQVTGSTVAALQAAVQAIETALRLAEEYAEGLGTTRVYVNLQPDGAATLYRSELYGGQVLWPETALKADWANKQVEVQVTWRRAGWWEGPETQLNLTNTNGTNTTNALRVFNCNDGSGSSPNDRCNYVTVASTVLGTMPAPVKLSMECSTAMTPPDWMLVTAGEYSNYFEVGNSGTGSVISNSGASGGSYLSTPLNTNNIPNVGAGKTTAVPDLSYYQLVLMRLHDAAPTGARARVRYRTYYGVALQETPVVDLDTRRLVVMGTLQPTVRLGPNSGNTNLPYLEVIAGGTSTDPLLVDTLQLLPVRSYVILQHTAGALPTDARTFWEDWIDGLNYYLNSSGGTIYAGLSYNRRVGPGIWVTPGGTNRLVFNWSLSGVATITDNMKVKMWYRPRWRTL